MPTYAGLAFRHRQNFSFAQPERRQVVFTYGRNGLNRSAAPDDGVANNLAVICISYLRTNYYSEYRLPPSARFHFTVHQLYRSEAIPHRYAFPDD